MECHFWGKIICTFGPPYLKAGSPRSYSRSNLQLTIFLTNQSTLKQA